jgi:hypothetical protein
MVPICYSKVVRELVASVSHAASRLQAAASLTETAAKVVVFDERRRPGAHAGRGRAQECGVGEQAREQHSPHLAHGKSSTGQFSQSTSTNLAVSSSRSVGQWMMLPSPGSSTAQQGVHAAIGSSRRQRLRVRSGGILAPCWAVQLLAGW